MNIFLKMKLNSKNPKQRSEALHELVREGGNKETEEIINKFIASDPDQSVRLYAIESAIKLKVKSANDYMIASGRIDESWEVIKKLITSDPDSSIRAYALEVAAVLKKTCAIDCIIAALNDKEKKVQNAAVQALIGLADIRAVDPIIQLILKSTKEGDDCWQEAAALSKFKHIYTIEKVSKLLNSPSPITRLAASRALGWMQVREVLPILEPFLFDPDPKVRENVAEGLDNSGWNHNNQLNEMIRHLAYGWYENIDAKYSIMEKPTLDAIARFCHLPDPTARKGGATVLHKVLEGKTESVQEAKKFIIRQLLELSEDKEVSVRYEALNSLWSQQGAEISAAFVRAAQDDDKKVRSLAVNWMGTHPDPALLDKIIPMLNDPDPWVQKMAVQSIEKLKEPKGIIALRELLVNPSCTCRKDVVTALRLLGWADATPMEKMFEGIEMGNPQAVGIWGKEVVRPILMKLNGMRENGNLDEAQSLVLILEKVVEQNIGSIDRKDLVDIKALGDFVHVTIWGGSSDPTTGYAEIDIPVGTKHSINIKRIQSMIQSEFD